MTDNKVIFYNGWVKLVNHNRYNSYGKGEKQDKAFKREMQFVPAFLKDYNINNTSIDTSIYTRHKSKYIIHKTKNIKREKKIKKEIHDLLVFFNLKYKTNYSSPRSLVNNYTYWKEQYTLEQMKRAITRSLADSWWRGRLTPEMLLRRKNLRNEDVDYIGKFLGMRLTKKKAAEATEEMIKEGLIEGGDEN